MQERAAELTVANEQLQREIVERKQAEEGLHESERRLRNAQRIAQVANWERDFETGKGYWSDEQYHLFGYEPNEIPDSHELFRKHLHPDDVPLVVEAIENSLASGTKFEIDARYIPKEEELRYAHIICNVELDENGNPRWLHGTFQDITERKQAEEALGESEERFRLAFENASIGICLVDTEGRLTKVNPQMSEIFGYSQEELEAMTVNDITHPEYLDVSPRFIQRASSGEITQFDLEKQYIHKNGHIIWGQVTSSLVRDIRDEPLYFISHVKDITERKQAEEALRRAHDELELRVEERTAELIRANEKLSRSEKELRLLSSQLLTVQEDERARIAGDLHDSIGQSLSVAKFKTREISGYLDKGVVEETAESCGILVSVIQDCIQEVREICMDLRPSLLDDLGILVTINWFCREFQELYPGISIESELSVEERQVPESLKIVIYRLLQEALNNIAKHSKADRVLVTVRRKDNTLELDIEDNGRGFDLEEVLSVESTKRGLGLGSMRERTGLSGGSFSIKTAKGAGTVVQASWQSEELESAKL